MYAWFNVLDNFFLNINSTLIQHTLKKITKL